MKVRITDKEGNKIHEREHVGPGMRAVESDHVAGVRFYDGLEISASYQSAMAPDDNSTGEVVMALSLDDLRDIFSYCMKTGLLVATVPAEPHSRS